MYGLYVYVYMLCLKFASKKVYGHVFVVIMLCRYFKYIYAILTVKQVSLKLQIFVLENIELLFNRIIKIFT